MLNKFRLARRAATSDGGSDPLAIRSLLDDPRLREMMEITDDTSSPGRSPAGRPTRRRRHAVAA